MTNSTVNEKYNELFKRNQPIIDLKTQDKIKKLFVLVAGCGSTGGAFIEGASRLGILNFRLVEPDHFEMHNLNRQFVYPSDLGINKAEVHKRRLLALFNGLEPNIEIFSNGLNSQNVLELICNVNIIFDAIDVTTHQGMQAKLTLHQEAANKKIPVLSALDLGFKQWIRYYDYRINSDPLHGLMSEALKHQHPLKSLIYGFCKLKELPVEILIELKRLLETKNSSACQIASSCHLLSSLTGPILIRFCQEKHIPNTVSLDLMREFETMEESIANLKLSKVLIQQIEKILTTID